MKLGIVFSGGGVKGIAHSGVLKALEEENIKFDVFTGTSSGSHVAFLSAIGYSADKIKKTYDANINRVVGKSDINKLSVFKDYLISRKFKIEGLRTGEIIELFYKDIGIENGIIKINNVEKSLGIVATDLLKEKEVWFTSKKIDVGYKKDIINKTDIEIGKVIRASSSFSIMFDPCRIEEDIYLDGGICNNTPVDLARALGADKVVAVVFEDDENNLEKFQVNMFNIGMKTLDIMSKLVSKNNIYNADVVVKVKGSLKNLLDVNNSEKYYKDGYLAMKSKMNEVKKLLV